MINPFKLVASLLGYAVIGIIYAVSAVAAVFCWLAQIEID